MECVDFIFIEIGLLLFPLSFRKQRELTRDRVKLQAIRDDEIKHFGLVKAERKFYAARVQEAKGRSVTSILSPAQIMLLF